MTPDRDAFPAPQPQRPSELAVPPHEVEAVARCREINERRARVENTELLRHLRGL